MDRPLDDEAPGAVRGHVTRGRGHLEAGRFQKADSEALRALALDPENEEAAEIAWRAERKLRVGRDTGGHGKEMDTRIEVLLSQAAPERPDEEARRAIAELALIAPDDPRVGEVIRERHARA
jgi:hypothetical protein